MNNKLHKQNKKAIFYCLNSNWWGFGLRGLVAIIFGCLMIFETIPTLLATTILFGVYSITDAVFSIICAINLAYKNRRWGSLMLSGVVSLILGVILLSVPQFASLELLIFLWVIIIIRTIAIGIFEIAAAIKLRNEIKGEWLLGLHGVFLSVLGIVMLGLYWFKPLESLLAFCLIIGCNAIASGILLLLLSFKLYQKQNEYSKSP